MPGSSTRRRQKAQGQALWDNTTLTISLFEPQFRRVGTLSKEFVSPPAFFPLGAYYQSVVVFFVARVIDIVGSAYVKIIFEDSSDGIFWASIFEDTLNPPTEDIYRYEIPPHFGAWFRMRLEVEATGITPTRLYYQADATFRRRPDKPAPDRMSGDDDPLPTPFVPQQRTDPNTRSSGCGCGGTCGGCGS